MRARWLPLVLAAGLVLGGCGANLGRGASSYRAMPEKGQCWEATQAQAAEWMAWEGGRPVDCSFEHTLETVAVLAVEGDFYGADGLKEYPQDYLDLAIDLCDDAWASANSWAPKPNRLSNFLFYPTLKKFNEGEHWVRCDVGVTAVGTAWVQEEYQLEVRNSSLASLKSDVDRDSNAITLCLDSKSDEIGASGELLTIADCDEPHRWDMVRASDLSISDDEKWPGELDIAKRAEIACIEKKPDSVKGWFWLTPSQSEWLDGIRTSYCFWSSAPTTSA